MLSIRNRGGTGNLSASGRRDGRLQPGMATMTVTEPIIRWVNVYKRFGDNVVLRGVTLDVQRGETLAVVGRSGVGKSVLLKTLLGLMAPDSGEVWVRGRRVTGSQSAMDEGRRLIGMVFQNSALFDSMTVAENIALPYWENTSLPREEVMERVTRLLGMVGLSKVEDLMPAALSGGMRKRVALARALADEPEIILYDEPTTGLDPIMADAINGLIIQMQRDLNVTSIVVTHEMATVRKVAHHVALLHNGEIIFHGTTEDLFTTDNPYVRQFIEGNAEGPITIIPSSTGGPDA